jgi:zinc protease
VLERVRAVTAEQVRAAAKQYFIDDKLTVVVLDPQPLDQAKPRPAPPGMRH